MLFTGYSAGAESWGCISLQTPPGTKPETGAEAIALPTYRKSLVHTQGQADPPPPPVVSEWDSGQKKFESVWDFLFRLVSAYVLGTN